MKIEIKEMAPIVMFVYNRVDHTQKTIEALLRNNESRESDLFIFSDAAKNMSAEIGVMDTRKYIHSIKGFKSVTIIEREQNMGLANSLINGISEIIKKYGRVIVVEDDIVTSPFFLRFMNEALEVYKDCERISSIQGYLFPINANLPETFLIKWQSCWGWATWERAWRNFSEDGKDLYDKLNKYHLVHEFNIGGECPFIDMLKQQIQGKINSWAIRWNASCFLNDTLVLYPRQSLVYNCGFDGNGGTNCKTVSHKYDTVLCQKPIIVDRLSIKESLVGRKAYLEFYRDKSPQPKGLRRIAYKMGWAPFLSKVKRRILFFGAKI